jgi:flagellar hook-length control protein FliK
MTASSIANAWMASRPGQTEFGRELGAQLTVWAREGLQQAQLHLHPSELGPIQVQIQMQGQEAQVQFVAEHAQTREALQHSLADLVAALQQEGLSLGRSDIQSQAGGREGRAGEDPSQAGARRFGMQSGTSGNSDLGPAQASMPDRQSARGLLDLYA